MSDRQVEQVRNGVRDLCRRLSASDAAAQELPLRLRSYLRTAEASGLARFESERWTLTPAGHAAAREAR